MPPARGDIEIAYGALNLRGDVVPIELRVLVNDVGRRFVAELPVQPDFPKLMQ